MSLESKSPNRFTDAPRDKPQVDRVEHANLERPGAQIHPSARGWNGHDDKIKAWRTR
jgi:hypothetical protein